MDEDRKWNVSHFWRRILGCNKRTSFIKMAGEPHNSKIYTLAVCNQALAEELYAHDKLTLTKQKADFLKRLG